MSRTFHMALSVRGALAAKNRDLKGWIRDDAGRLLSPDEARDALMDELSRGNEFIPFDKSCDNFDPKSGCRGHPAPAAARSRGDNP